MQISLRTMALTIVLLFVGSLMTGFTAEYNTLEPVLLERRTGRSLGLPSNEPRDTLSLDNTFLLTTAVTVQRPVVGRMLTTQSSKFILMNMCTLPTCLPPTETPTLHALAT